MRAKPWQYFPVGVKSHTGVVNATINNKPVDHLCGPLALKSLTAIPNA